LIKTVQGGDINLSNSTGKMVAQILGSVQEQESAHHSERRKFAYVPQGKYDTHGNRTFGYGATGEPLERSSLASTAVAPRRRGGGNRRKQTPRSMAFL
jgi:hypothetical protein